jgi:hypothetical protein
LTLQCPASAAPQGPARQPIAAEALCCGGAGRLNLRSLTSNLTHVMSGTYAGLHAIDGQISDQS